MNLTKANFDARFCAVIRQDRVARSGGKGHKKSQHETGDWRKLPNLRCLNCIFSKTSQRLLSGDNQLERRRCCVGALFAAFDRTRGCSICLRMSESNASRIQLKIKSNETHIRTHWPFVKSPVSSETRSANSPAAKRCSRNKITFNHILAHK